MGTAVDNWLFMLLAFAFFQPDHGIQVFPDQTPAKSQQQVTKPLNSNSTNMGDSQLSSSERNRRLIPYMAFYLPPPQYPINQQYTLQRPQKVQDTNIKQHHSVPPTATDSAGPLPPPPERIPIPTAYVHMSVPAVATTGKLQNYQPSPGELYHTFSYGGTYPVLVSHEGVKGKQEPTLHLLPPGLPLQPHTGSLIAYKESSAHKQNSVQHFPPTVAAEHQQQHQQYPYAPSQQQQITYRQRPKQSKFNLTPFTPSNTVPGHFIPIIYTPVTSGSSNNRNTINYTYSSQPTAHEGKQQQEQIQQTQERNPQRLQQYKNSQHHQQQQTAVPYQQLPPQSEAAEVAQSPSPPPHYQLQFKTVTAAPLSAKTSATGSPQHPTPSPIYHQIIHEASATPMALTLHELQHQREHQNNQHQSQHTQYQFKSQHSPLNFRQKDPQYQPANHEDFFNEPYSNAENMTPQEKYVSYLKQRLRFNKAQQKQRENSKARESFAKQHQQQTFVVSTTASPLYSQGPIELQQHGHIELQHHSQQHSNHPSMQRGHPQHSPIRHAVHPGPHLSVPANHQPHPKPIQQQVLHIPLRQIFKTLDTLHQQDHQLPAQQQEQQQSYPLVGSLKNSHYIDYSIEEPKQSLDDELQRQDQTLLNHKPTDSPDVAPTAALHHSLEPQRNEYYGSTTRTVYKNRPTLRLQPVPHESDENYPTSPRNPTSSPTIPPPRTTQQPIYEYVYVSTQPTYRQMLKPTPSIKLRPSYSYETKTTVQPTQGPSIEHKEQVPQYATPAYPIPDPNQLPDIRSSSLAEILHKLQASNHLPQTLTPDNIDNSIKTLITILNHLKQTQTIMPNPPQHHETPAASPEYDYAGGSEEEHREQDLNVPAPVGPNRHPGPSTGRAGIDYPNYAEIPQTSFSCGEQRYKGFFGDPETKCQVWHYCDLNGGKASFLCPNGTIFSQIALTCDWWFNVKCSTTEQLYVLNERLYKYILPFNPKFPEDYSGPIVDKYLAMKFQEMEQKMRLQKQKPSSNESEPTAQPPMEDAKPTVQEPTLAVDHSHGSVNSLVSEQSSERNLLIDDEVDDISHRGSYDTYENKTQVAPTFKQTEVPLSLKPIVVTSTIEPEYNDGHVEDRETDDTTEPVQETPISMPSEKISEQEHESTKVSVEKVEVIEIKTDGASGHLTPVMLLNNAVDQR